MSSSECPVKVYCRFKPALDPSQTLFIGQNIFCAADQFNEQINSGHLQFCESNGQNGTVSGASDEENVPTETFIFAKTGNAVRYVNHVQQENMDFVFDKVFNEKTEQKEVYEVTTKPLLDEVLCGYNCTVFAYGQTASGKTHTMLGKSSGKTNYEDFLGCKLGPGDSPRSGLYVSRSKGQMLRKFGENNETRETQCDDEDHEVVEEVSNDDANEEVGIIPRVAKDVFSRLKTKQKNGEIDDFEVSFSALEIYLEKIRDLLPKSFKSFASGTFSTMNTGKFDSLKIRQGKDDEISVEGATEHVVNNPKQLLDFVRKASSRRVVGTTHMNSDSSRSHSLFVITVETRSSSIRKKSKLILVDLAGNEVIKRTKTSHVMLEEAKMINRSLLSLGNVVKALVENKGHVPYRDAKLTRLLQDSLGGNSKTSFILTCSLSPFDVSETLSTLRFGKRAKSVVNKPVSNSLFTDTDFAICQRGPCVEAISKLSDEVKALENEKFVLLEEKLQDDVIIRKLQSRNMQLKASVSKLKHDLNQKLLQEKLTLLSDSFKEQPSRDDVVKETRARAYQPHFQIPDPDLLSPVFDRRSHASKGSSTGSHSESKKEDVTCKAKSFHGEKASFMITSELQKLKPSSSEVFSYYRSASQKGSRFGFGLGGKSAKTHVVNFYPDVPPPVQNNDLEKEKEKSSIETILIEMTKRLVDMKAELTRKSEELMFANRLLQNKSKKYFKMGFLKHGGSQAISTKEFMEIIKRKDDALTHSEAEVIELRKQLNQLDSKYSSLEFKFKQSYVKVQEESDQRV